MFDIQEELKKLPEKPGVYIMKDEFGEIIYIGKAVILKNRVRQYFQHSANHSPKVYAMVARIKEFEYIITDSELEALILECNLIKKHKPKFNILLKDDKHYPYIKVTLNEEYPRVLVARRIDKDGAKYFGPYSSAYAVKDTIALLKRLFPFKSCTRVLPRDIGKGRPCLNYHISQCMGPCSGNVNIDEYREMMKDICSFLSGKQEEVIKRLEGQMKAASENLDFEKAAAIRDRIKSIQHIGEKQKVLSTALEDQDIIAFAKGPVDSCIQVFFVRGGKLIGREHFIFEEVGDVGAGELMESFIKQFYNAAQFVPKEILLQEDIDEIKIIESWLSSKKSSKVHIKVPRRGEKLKLIEMVSQNAMDALEHFRDKLKKEEAIYNGALKDLGGILGLEKTPERIEAYDISNTGSSEMVGSMVVFNKGISASDEYRRFKIKTVEGQNDYGSMQEVIYRRFKRARIEIEEGSGKEGGFSTLPDLILLDGGLGHVTSISQVMEELGIDIPVFGMVKNEHHRTRGLATKQGEIGLSDKPQVLRLVTAIQDEAHRFAIEYNKKLRHKRYNKSVLDEVPGIGPKRKKALIKHFGSVSRVKSATVEELMAVDGISRSAAEKIFVHFR